MPTGRGVSSLTEPTESSSTHASLERVVEPVAQTPRDEAREPEEGVALCLSGGGYRAMLFHLGSLILLNEVGRLRDVARISSVSGGSITAGVLGLAWNNLSFGPDGRATNFDGEVIKPVRRLASRTLDSSAVVRGLLWRGSIGDRVARGYRDVFGDATLQDLPDQPQFFFNATNVQSGALWRFSKLYMRDYRVGEVKQPNVPIAVVVAASSAFPPFLSPLTLKVASSSYTPNSGDDLQREPFTTRVVLTDGGVYDNLGLETAWKRYTDVLVSDGGGKLQPEGEPKHDWARHTRRVLSLIDNQVRSLRKRQLIWSYETGLRKGAYWGIRTNITNYELSDSLPCPHEQTLRLAAIDTRLAALETLTQERLINWGYAVCDAALRAHVDSAIPAPTTFPYPLAGVG